MKAAMKAKAADTAGDYTATGGTALTARGVVLARARHVFDFGPLAVDALRNHAADVHLILARSQPALIPVSRMGRHRGRLRRIPRAR